MSFPSGDARLVLSDACDGEGVGGRGEGGGCRVVLAHEHAAGRRLGLGGAVLSAGRGGAVSGDGTMKSSWGAPSR